MRFGEVMVTFDHTLVNGGGFTAFALGAVLGNVILICGYSIVKKVRFLRTAKRKHKKTSLVIKGDEYFSSAKVPLWRKDFCRLLYSKPVVILAIFLEIILCVLSLALIAVLVIYFWK